MDFVTLDTKSLIISVDHFNLMMQLPESQDEDSEDQSAAATTNSDMFSGVSIRVRNSDYSAGAVHLCL